MSNQDDQSFFTDTSLPPSARDVDDTPPTSPIRPTRLDDTEPQPLLTPTPPDNTKKTLTPREHMQRAEEALINLREKIAHAAAEFNQGKLNQAQFDAIYRRYSEQRDITERLLMRDPESQAWQSVIQVGHTQFLKQHYQARETSYAIYDQDTAELISMTGALQIQTEQVQAMLTRLKAVIQQRGNPGPAQRKLPDDRCVLFVPGECTIAVVIFSREPATNQIQRIQDIHHDFERANQHALQRKDYNAARMVFPHRALFEEKK